MFLRLRVTQTLPDDLCRATLCIVAVSYFSRAVRVAMLVGFLGCGLDQSGDEGSSGSSAADANLAHGHDGGGLTGSPSPDGGATLSQGPPGSDDAGDADPSGDAASDDAGTVDDGPSGPMPSDAASVVDAGSVSNPCDALKPCCAQIAMLSSTPACDNAVKANNAPTCTELLADFKSDGLCH